MLAKQRHALSERLRHELYSAELGNPGWGKKKSDWKVVETGCLLGVFSDLRGGRRWWSGGMRWSWAWLSESGLAAVRRKLGRWYENEPRASVCAGVVERKDGRCEAAGRRNSSLVLGWRAFFLHGYGSRPKCKKGPYQFSQMMMMASAMRTRVVPAVSRAGERASWPRMMLRGMSRLRAHSGQRPRDQRGVVAG